jgi:hypothetical protein
MRVLPPHTGIILFFVALFALLAYPIIRFWP